MQRIAAPKAKLGRGFSYLTDIQNSLIGRERDQTFLEQAKAPTIAKKIGITSGKGGTGKSVLACNLSIYLARVGRKVTILDADFGLANDHIIFGVYPSINIAHMLRGDNTLEDIIVACPEGVRLIPGASGIEWAADLNAAEICKIAHALENIESSSDFLLIDTSAGISKHTLLLLLACDEIVVVTNRDVTAMTDAYAISKAVFKLKPAARIWLVVNRVISEKEAHSVFRKMNEVAQKFIGKQLDYLGYVMDSTLVDDSINSKVPFFIKYPYSDISVAVAKMGRALSSNGFSQAETSTSGFLHTRIRNIMSGATS